jgi:hypothetical protein
VASPRAVVYLTENLVAGSANRLAHSLVLGLGDEQVSTVFELEGHLIRRRARIAAANADFHEDIFLSRKTAIDLGEVVADAIDVGVSEVVSRRSHA